MRHNYAPSAATHLRASTSIAVRRSSTSTLSLRGRVKGDRDCSRVRAWPHNYKDTLTHTL